MAAPKERPRKLDSAEQGPGVEQTPESAALLFQSHPDDWDLRQFFVPGEHENWRATSYRDELRPGRLVLLWEAKGSQEPEVRGLYGWGITDGEIYGDRPKRIPMRYIERWVAAADASTEPELHMAALPAAAVLALDSWREHRLATFAAGTNFVVTAEQLVELVDELVLPTFPGTQLAQAVEAAVAGRPIDAEGFTPATLIEEAPAPESHAVSLRILSDAPIRTLGADRLGFDKYADAIAGLINEPKTSTPLTLAINARWGVGKSSLAHLVQDALRSRSRLGGSRHITCWFDAWMHDDAENLTPSLLAHVARTANRERPFWRRICQPIPTLLLPTGERWRGRILRLSLFVALGIAITTLALAYRFPDAGPEDFWKLGRDLVAVLATDGAQANAASEASATQQKIFGGAWITLLAVLFKGWTFLWGSARAIASFVSNPKDEAKTGSLPKVRQQIGNLIRQATRNGDRRFVLFIDDLERCRPPLAVGLLEAVNQLLNHRDVVTLVMADMPGVEAHVQIKYEDLAARYQVAVRDIPEPVKDEAARSRTYGRHYLSKIVQLQFDLPRAVNTDRLLDPPRPRKKVSVGQLFVESISRLFDFADGRQLDLLAPLTSNLVRWRDRGPIARPLVATLWLLALPALTAGALAEVLASLLPISRERDTSLGSPSDSGAAVLALLSVPVLLAVAIAAVVTGGGSPTADYALVYGIALALVFVLIALGRAIESLYQRALRKRFEKRVDELVEEDGGNLETTRDAEEVARRLEADPVLAQFAARQVGKDLLREKHLHRLSESSNLLKAAWKPADRYLPMIPRHLKRFHNRLRLLLYIADRRSMFGDNPTRVAWQIGKWAVLQEVWPELAQKLSDRPERMRELEREPATRLKTLKKLVPRYGEDSELLAFLAEEPKLADDLERLTRFRPSSAGA